MNSINVGIGVPNELLALNTRLPTPQSLDVSSKHVFLDTDVVLNTAVNLLAKEFLCSLQIDKVYYLERKITINFVT